jgi:hypothetical protein
MEQHLAEAKLLTFSREPGISLETLFNKQKEHGFKMVMDVDDSWNVPYRHEFYSPRTAKWQEIIIKLAKTVDGITTTTERLKQKLLPLNENVYVIPNAVPFDGQYAAPERNYHSPIRFGYVGGSTHFWDVKTIASVFPYFPDLNFTLAGYNNPKQSPGNVWAKIERICSNNFKNPNYKRLPSLDLFSFMSHYDEIDVAIAPLEDIPFNSFKSSLKAYEAGAKKCAFICSAVPPYTDDLPDDVVSFCKSTADWKQAIKKHKNNPAYTKDQGEKLFQWVLRNRNLQAVNDQRIPIFNEIISECISSM